jgi:hypothetical protein
MWACELGRIDILPNVSKLSHFLASPRVGHLEQVFHIYAYIKQHDRSRLVLDDSRLAVDETVFTTMNWEFFYPGAIEANPPNMPEALGKAVTTTCYIDADHALCLATWQSHTGVLLYVNSALVLWHSMRQNTVEASTFGSEFIAAKTAAEMIEGLRDKLHRMGFPLLGPTSVLCDNQSVVTNASRPESTISKKHNSIPYHLVRKAQTGYIPYVSVMSAAKETKCLDGVQLRHIQGRVPK